MQLKQSLPQSFWLVVTLHGNKENAMNVKEACAVIAVTRQNLCPDAPLVSTMSAMNAFDELGVTNNRLDSVPLMGGASCLGLGIALMKPQKQVIVVDGDASLLMELGSLVTVTNAKPKRFLHILMHNNTQFSGMINLPTAGTEPDCNFAKMAKSAGYQDVHEVNDLVEWERLLPQLINQTGSTFVDLRITPSPARFGAQQPQPILPNLQFERMPTGVAKLKAALAA
jgi:Thiamine pyrophosphate enzyme, C-terminal TPP binding domain